MTEEVSMDRVGYAPWVTTDGASPFPTQHLPADVVDQPFVLVVESVRFPEDGPRVGGVWFSLNFAGRENPGDLTDDEKEYVLGMVRGALDALPGRKGDGE